MEIRHRFWVEERSRAVWAVELHGHVVRACYGPLTLNEIDDDLIESFEYASGGTAWIRENAEHFTPYVSVIPDFAPT